MWVLADRRFGALDAEGEEAAWHPAPGKRTLTSRLAPRPFATPLPMERAAPDAEVVATEAATFVDDPFAVHLGWPPPGAPATVAGPSDALERAALADGSSEA